ncbi:MAG: hypothetical protein M0R41_09335 [Methylobacter tundripaludum]|nr:hypothetical protein [Methylobacter tundripaludum]
MRQKILQAQGERQRVKDVFRLLPFAFYPSNQRIPTLLPNSYKKNKKNPLQLVHKYRTESSINAKTSDLQAAGQSRWLDTTLFPSTQ